MANTVGEKKKADIATPSVRYEAMREKWSWDLIGDLLSGTRAMRKAGKKWQPQQEAESANAYKARLDRSFLFEGFGNTIDRLSARPFKKDVTWDEEGLDPRLDEVFNDVDDTGRNMTQLAYDMLQTGMKWGLAHVLVDFPVMQFFNSDGTSRKATKAEEKAAGARPIWSEISPINLFFWKVGNDRKLTEIRFFENSVQDEGDFGDDSVQQIRRFTRTSWELWEKKETDVNGEDTWAMVNSGKHTFGEIPLATFYTDQEGLLTAKPPLHKLAWLNLTHWQSYSDQRNLLNVARAGVLFIKGVTQEQIDDNQVTVGPRSQFATTNQDADMKWVEHSGKSIEAGQKDIEDIENKMTVVGTEPLVISGPKETATGRAVDANANESQIQAWIRRLESALGVAAEFSAQWLNIELPKDFSFDIFSDFGVILGGAEDLTNLLAARTAREISQQTYLEEIRRRGAISEGVDIEEEMERLNAEGPALGLIGGDDDDTDENKGGQEDDDNEMDN